MRYLIKFSYDGSKFNGFQSLKSNDAVQNKLDEALSVINKAPVHCKGAGRTDRGVHAYDQGAHFDLDVNVPPERLIRAINSLVGDYIYVHDCRVVDKDFHARFNIERKRYIYKIYQGEYDPLKFDYALYVRDKLDIKLMEKCAKLYEGVHNFRNFVAGERKNNEAIIYSVKIKHNDKDILIEFEGKSFYRYMVRNLVGALLDVGLHKQNIEDVKSALNGDEVHISTASARGLYLEMVSYKEK